LVLDLRTFADPLPFKISSRKEIERMEAELVQEAYQMRR